MKNLKSKLLLLLAVTALISCEKDTFNFEESSEDNTQVSGKSYLQSKDDIIAYYNVEGNLFALDDDAVIYSFQYDVITDAIEMTDFSQDTEDATGEYKNFSIDTNPNDGLVYLLSGYDDEDRYIFRYDMETGIAVKISDVLRPVDGDGYANKISFDADGNCYILFGGGEINKYDLETGFISSFSNVSYRGKVGLTYDFDNDRLIYSTGTNPIDLYAIDIPSGNVIFLFDVYTSFKSNTNSAANGIEYVGNNKLLVAGMNYPHFMFTIDLINQSKYDLLDLNDDVMDLMYFVDPDIDGDGVLNEDDPYPNSNMNTYLYFGEDQLNIENKFSDEGTTMMDQIDALIAQINEQYDGSNGDALHRMFTRELSKITYYWYKSRLISRRERTTILRAANNANIPYVDFD